MGLTKLDVEKHLVEHQVLNAQITTLFSKNFLKLDASNSPITGQLEIKINSTPALIFDDFSTEYAIGISGDTYYLQDVDDATLFLQYDSVNDLSLVPGRDLILEPVGDIIVTNGIIIGKNSEKINIGVTDDMIEFVGAGGTANQTLRIDLDDSAGPDITTTTGTEIKFSERLNISATGFDSSAGTIEGVDIAADNGGGGGANNFFGGVLCNSTDKHTSGTQGTSYGGRFFVNHFTAENTTNVVGGYFEARKTKSGATVSRMVGGRFDCFGNNSITGTVTSMYGWYCQKIDVEELTATNVYGGRVGSIVIGDGSATNVYGIRIDEQTVGTNNFGIAIFSDTIGLTLGLETEATIYSNDAGVFNFQTSVADTDLTFNFEGTTNSGVFKWMEDEDYFDFQDTVKLSAGIIQAVATKTNNYTILQSDYTIIADGTSNTVDITLPAIPNTGQIFVIKCKNDTNTVTVARNGKNIDGDASDLTLIEDEVVELQYDGTEWWIL